MSIISGVYKITLKTDGRIYIGSSADIHKRWDWHLKSQVQLIGKMLKKYGENSFLFEVIETCAPTKEALQEREQYYLDSLQPFPWVKNQGFNLSPHAYTPLGIKRSEETRQKMRDSWHKNRGEEYYRKLSERISGDKNPAKRPEVREKISKSRKGQTWKDDIDRVTKHKEARIGKKHTEQARANMKLAQQKNNTRSREAREKFYLAQRRLYEVTSPDGSTFQMFSRELKLFCLENNLQYSNLISTAKNKKSYKGGWCAVLVKI